VIKVEEIYILCGGRNVWTIFCCLPWHISNFKNLEPSYSIMFKPVYNLYIQ